MASKAQEKTVRLEPEVLREPTDIPAAKSDGRYHVDLFLRASNVPLWERGGKRAFAIQKDSEFATDEEFEKLFEAY